MNVLRRILRQLPLYLAWIVLSAIFWSWIFTLVTDTRPENKVTLLVSAPALEDRPLAAALEEEKPEGIRMIKVHPFSYAVFDEGSFLNADLYVVPESKAAEFLDAFVPVDPPPGAAVYAVEGVPYGIRIYTAAAGEGAAMDYIQYVPAGGIGEDYYLFLGANSLHAGKKDFAALKVAEKLLRLE